MNKLFITTIILTFLFAGHANAQFSSLMKKAIDKQAKKNAINEYDPNKPVNFNDNSISFYQLGDRYVCTANLIKGGKLKSLLKNNTEITKLIINGIIDEKDIEIKTAMIVCKAFHARRCLMLYQMAFPDVSFIVRPVHCYNITKDNWYTTEEGIDRVLGELTRCGNQFVVDIKNYLK